MCDVGRPHAILNHLLEKPDARGDVVRLHAAVHERVVDQLIATKASLLYGFCNLERFVQVTEVAVPLQDRGEGDKVGFQSALRCHHLLEQALGGCQVVALYARVDDGVEGDGVVRHALSWHFAEKLQGLFQVLVEPIPLDERGVQYRVLVLPLCPHSLENLHRLAQVATLDAGIDHAAVRHGVGLTTLPLHLVPDVQDLLQVPRLAICLHKDSQCHGRRRDLQLPHARGRGLKTAQVLKAAAGIQHCVEEHLVHVIGLAIDELLHDCHAPVHAGRIEADPAVAHCLHQHPGDCELVRQDALPLHLLQGGPRLVDAPLPHDILQGVAVATTAASQACVSVGATTATGVAATVARW
mmetsp:Transcript_57625/g.160562  ORF Transcript_57625/g.160562 Transcript_57625/m.160562 type:complete len:354 (+) Transcript_57625:1203-2264(+)